MLYTYQPVNDQRVNTRTLGNSGLKISALGIGCMTLSSGYEQGGRYPASRQSQIGK